MQQLSDSVTISTVTISIIVPVYSGDEYLARVPLGRVFKHLSCIPRSADVMTSGLGLGISVDV